MTTMLEAEEKLKKNLEYFKAHQPVLYEICKKYRLKKFKLFIDDDKELNFLIGEEKGYPYAPRQFCKDQLDSGLLYKVILPLPGRPSPHALPTINYDYLAKLFDTVIEPNRENFGKDYYFKDKYIPFLIVMGLGLAYHIEYLLEKFDIEHMIIFEPDFDMFYLSLYVVDWEKCFKYFLDKDGSLIFEIDPKTIDEENYDFNVSVTNLQSTVLDLNPVFSHYVTIFPHRDITHLVKDLPHNVLHTILGFGFYDDEKWSTEHTLINIKDKIPAFYINKNKNNNVFNDTPVFILGGGPSLDYALDKIKKYKDRAIIFSCGSSLRTCEKQDIFPDFHLEIERTKEQTYESLIILNNEFLKQIPIIANNTIPNEAFNLFKEKYMFLKANDAGLIFFPPYLPPLAFSNPTVVNGALSVVLNLGFKNIYLFGADCGFKDPKHHHAKDNIAMDKDSQFFIEEIKEAIPVEANFEGPVYTDTTLMFCKTNIEQILEQFKKQELKVYNTSDGAKIKYTEPLRIEQFNLDDVYIDKNLVINLIKNNFTTNYLNDLPDFKEFFRKLDIVLDACIKLLNKKVSNRTELINIFFNMYQYALGYTIIRGSILHFQHAIYTYAFIIKEEEKALEFINNAFTVFKDFLIKVKEDVRENVYTLVKND